MPLAFIEEGGDGRRVPMAREPFSVGRAPDADLVLPSEELAPYHALVRHRQGEFILGAKDGARFRVNGQSVPFMALRDGDRVELLGAGGEVAARLRFHSRLGGAFVPPEASLAEAWMAHPSFDAAAGPEAFGAGVPIAGRPTSRCRRVTDTARGFDLVVKILGPVADAARGDRHLRLILALAGAHHPGLAQVVDGGIAGVAAGPCRWLASRWVDGETASDRLAAGNALGPAAALAVLRPLAGALVHLHRRGILHRDVAPSNVVITPDGAGVLIDPGHAVHRNDAGRVPAAVVGTPGYVAPEAVLADGRLLTPAADVYGLAAVGYALVTGHPPARGDDVLETLARASSPPPRPRDLGVELPVPLESALVDALAPDPAARPDAVRFHLGLAFAHAELGLGGDE